MDGNLIKTAFQSGYQYGLSKHADEDVPANDAGPSGWATSGARLDARPFGWDDRSAFVHDRHPRSPRGGGRILPGIPFTPYQNQPSDPYEAWKYRFERINKGLKRFGQDPISRRILERHGIQLPSFDTQEQFNAYRDRQRKILEFMDHYYNERWPSNPSGSSPAAKTPEAAPSAPAEKPAPSGGMPVQATPEAAPSSASGGMPGMVDADMLARIHDYFSQMRGPYADPNLLRMGAAGIA